MYVCMGTDWHMSTLYSIHYKSLKDRARSHIMYLGRFSNSGGSGPMIGCPKEEMGDRTLSVSCLSAESWWRSLLVSFSWHVPRALPLFNDQVARDRG